MKNQINPIAFYALVLIVTVLGLALFGGLATPTGSVVYETCPDGQESIYAEGPAGWVHGCYDAVAGIVYRDS